MQDFSQVSNIYYLPIINEMSTTIEIIDDTAVISNDVTFETYEKCITKLAVPKGTKSKNKLDWPVFKMWCAKTLLTIIPSFDFDLFFTDSEANVSYISVPPNMFGNVLSAAIKAYFESNVYERFEDEYGLALYSKLNHEIASLNCFKIEIFRELNNKINNPSKLNDLANYLSLASHHVPESKLLAATVFCSVIPKLVAAPFLQAIETYLPSKRKKLMSANVKDRKSVV